MSIILVPIDGSEPSERILSLMGRLPNPQAVKLLLLLIVDFEDEALAWAMSYLGDLERRLHKTGFQVQHALQAGDPAERILATAALLRPSLVAISTKGKGGATGHGSVAAAVLRACPVPLLMANPDPLPLEPGLGFARILVPLDGTDTSARVLPQVEGLALQFGSEVILLNVGPTQDATHDLTAQRDALQKAGVDRVRVMNRTGDAASEILAVLGEENVELLALTSHSRSDVTERSFGSVAETLVREAPCPLFIDRVVIPGDV